MSEEEIKEYDALITRSTTHTRVISEEKPCTSTPKSRKTDRGKYSIHCAQHATQQQAPSGCNDCVLFPMELTLPNGRLPTNSQVLSYYFTMNQNQRGVSNFDHICLDIMLHWISCNVYTVSRKSVRKKLDDLINDFRVIQKNPKAKRGNTFYSKLAEFKSHCDSLFNIRCLDETRKKVQEKLWDVDETAEDIEFYEKQLAGKVSLIYLSLFIH